MLVEPFTVSKRVVKSYYRCSKVTRTIYQLVGMSDIGGGFYQYSGVASVEPKIFGDGCPGKFSPEWYITQGSAHIEEVYGGTFEKPDITFNFSVNAPCIIVSGSGKGEMYLGNPFMPDSCKEILTLDSTSISMKFLIAIKTGETVTTTGSILSQVHATVQPNGSVNITYVEVGGSE